VVNFSFRWSVFLGIKSDLALYDKDSESALSCSLG
jgi:hypothetical protein